jgi:pimeloyl-ACP methyl ester carboxylesterase
MMLATAQPSAIAGAILNDIGPVIETPGLLRIKSYVGKLPRPKTFEEGADLLRRLFESQFPKLSADAWMAFARRTFKQRKGGLAPTYDRRLANGLKDISLERPPPPLWEYFDALAHVPVMVIRGSNSDLLSPATVAAMVARRANVESVEVPDQGHAPLLVEDDIVRRIGEFIAKCETAGRL